MMSAGLQADICQLGMDQRKVNMLAREYCDKIKRKLKPVILSHEMLPGLLEVCSLSITPPCNLDEFQYISMLELRHGLTVK